MKTLEIHETWPSGSILLIDAVNKCSSLENISLSVATAFNVLSIRPTINFMELTKLSLTSENNVNDHMLSLVASGLPQLQSLNISGTSKSPV